MIGKLGGTLTVGFYLPVPVSQVAYGQTRLQRPKEKQVTCRFGHIPATLLKLKGSSCYPEPISLAPGRLLQECQEFKVSLSYIASLTVAQEDLLCLR